MYPYAFTEFWAKPRIITDPRTTPGFTGEFVNGMCTYMLRS